MANPEHLKILKQGGEAWNKWREENPEEKPDLSKADFVTEDFFKINFREANLDGTNFSGANLDEADLTGASLSSAQLHGTNLIKAVLKGASLQDVKLRGADLAGADLREANFLESNLSRASFRGANLRRANLNATNLSEALFNDADIREANLREANLLGADLTNTDITGAKIYGISYDDWEIHNIKCDFIYLDKKGEVRFPRNRNFMEGEFEELYKSLPTIEYIFEKGFTIIDIVLMNQVILEINERHPEFGLKIDSFHSRGQQHAKFTVVDRSCAEKAINQITNNYENKIKYIEGQKDQLMKVISVLSSNPQTQLINLIGKVVEEFTKRPQIQANEIKGLIYSEKINEVKQQYGDTTNIQSNGDVAYSKDDGKSVIVKDSQAGIIGDNAEVKGGIHFNERKAKQKP